MPDKDGDDEKKSTKSVVNKKQKPDVQTEGLKKIGKNVKNFFDKTLKFDSKYSNEPSVRSGARTPESTHMFKHVPSYNKDGTTGVYGQKGADFVKDKIKKGSKSLLDKGIEYVKNNPKQAGIIGAAAAGTGLAYAGIKGLQKRGERKAIAKSVVRQLEKKKMMGEEGYDIARDMGRVRPSKDKKDATTMPPSKEMEKTRKVYKGPSALELVKKKYKGQIMDVGKKKVKEELDLTKVAEAFGGYIVEANGKDKNKQKKDNEPVGKDNVPFQSSTFSYKKNQSDKETQQRSAKKSIEADASRRRTQGAGDRKNLGSGKGSERVTGGEDKLKGTEDQIKGIKTGTRPVEKDVIKRITKEVDDEQVLRGPRADRSGSSARGYDSITKMMRKQAAQDRRAEKLKDPKFRASETLRKAKQTDIKGGSSVKRGDPVPQKEIPTKKKPVPEIGGYQFNTFKPEIMARRKTFKQAFGQPTGADPKTGKPTYMRPGVLDKDGKPRPAQKRSKLLPDVDTVKTAIDMGVNPDEIDKNKFIDQKVRDNRMKRLGTPDPFDPDYDKKVKKVDQRTKIAKGFKAPKFQTAQRPMEVDRQTEVDAEKIGSQLKKAKKGFKDFDRRMRDTKVDADIERTIAGSGGGGRKTKIGTGTALDPEVVKNGRAKNAIDVTNVKEPSAFSQAKDKIRDFAKKDPVAALAAYDMGKGLLGKIRKLRIPKLVGGRAINVSAKGGGAA